MRIVIDMQGAQSESRFRGIGRYTMSFTQALVRNRGDHEIILALNGLFPDTIEPIRAAFDSLLPQENIRVWHAPGPVRDCEPGNEGRREVAEIIREAFLASPPMERQLHDIGQALANFGVQQKLREQMQDKKLLAALSNPPPPLPQAKPAEQDKDKGSGRA